MKTKFIIGFSVFLLTLISFNVFPQGNCLDFDGTNDYVTVPDDNTLDFGTGKFTVEFWIKTSSTDADIIYKHDGSNGWWVGFYSGYLYFDLNTSVTDFGNVNAYCDNSWHHLAFIVEYGVGLSSSKYKVSFYADGVFVASSNYGSKSISSSNSVNLYLGEGNSSPYVAGFLDGQMEEIRIWNIARTGSQISQNLYNEISPSSTGLVAYYKLNETTGSAMSDETSNSNDGTLSNFALSGTTSNWVTSTVPWTYTTTSSAVNWSSGSSWDKGTYPNNPGINVNITYPIIVDGDYTVDEITASANITVNATASLTASKVIMNLGTLDIISDNAGNVGSVVCPSFAGSTKLQRIVSENQWHYISSPLASTSSWLFTGAAVYYYNEPVPEYTAISGGVSLTSGQGYDIYYPNTGNKTVVFSGTFNTGNVSPTLTYNASQGKGFNLVGNPYPSTIDWGLFTDSTSATPDRKNIWDATYIWNGSAVQTYSNGVGANGGSRYIAATQGFFVRAYASSPSITFKPKVQATNNVYARSNNSVNVLRVYINQKDFSDETVIRFHENATEKFDGSFDAFQFESPNKLKPMLYTIGKNNVEYSINSIPNLITNQIIPLNAYIGVSDNYSISFNFENYKEEFNVFLEDKFTGNIVDARQVENYTFYGKNSDDADRFNLIFSPKSKINDDNINLTGIESETSAPLAEIFSNRNDIYISNQDDHEYQYFVFDLLGHQVKSGISKTGTQKISMNGASGVYIVKLTDQTNSLTQKIHIF